jgi:hypothetical protein
LNPNEFEDSKLPMTSLRAAGQIASCLGSTQYVHVAWNAIVTDEMLREVVMPRWASIIEDDNDQAAERIIRDLLALSEDMRQAWLALTHSDKDTSIANVISNIVRDYYQDNS